MAYDLQFVSEKGPNFSVIISPEGLRRVEEVSGFDKALGIGVQHGVAKARADESLKLIFDSTNIGKKAPSRRDAAARAVTEILSSLTDPSLPDECFDPALIMRLGLRKHRGKLPLKATVSWPNLPDADIQASATSSMQEIARAWLYAPQRSGICDRLVSQVCRESGVELNLDSQGSKIRTNRVHYDSSSPTFELNGYGIYTPLQQLICVRGIVAVAYPEPVATD